MSMPLRPGDPTRLGPYGLIARLGQGGMGSVFLGRAPDDRLVAVKVVRPEFADDPEFRGRFRSEVSRARQVPPFSTAAVLDAAPDHDPPYLVVEYVDGPSLTALVREQGPLTGAALQSVAVGVATALTAIHGAGVIHRDLKPGNVLFALGGIKVIDFGIARAFEATSRHTSTDQMVGTVAYMAPERLDPAFGAEVTTAVDVFAWGAVVTYAATGHTPFTGESPTVTAMRILTQPPDTSGVPEPLRSVVERTLVKYPEQRPSARELLDLLLATQSGAVRPVAVPAPPDDVVVDAPTSVPAPHRRPGHLVRRWAVAGAALVVLAVAGLVGGHMLNANRTTGATATPPPSAQAPVDPLTAILAGDRRFSLQLGDSRRFFMLEDGNAELDLSDGTGSRSQFVLKPVGVDYMIQSLTNEGYASAPICLGVKIDPEEPGTAPLVATACTPTKATLFSLGEAGRDADGRPAYTIGNAYGFLLWDAEAKRSDVDEVGEARYADKYTFVDRGEPPAAAATSAPGSPEPAAVTKPPASSTSGPKLVDADVSMLKNYAIDLGKPVVITLTGDSGGDYHLRSHPDGSVDLTGTGVTESTRMTIKPAQVRKRSEANQNQVQIVATPKVPAAGAPACLTDVRETVLRMEPCRAGEATQAWKLTPAGDSGLFEIKGAHTALRSETGSLLKEGGWSAFQTIAVAP
ncbi:serine/threonine protein kinase [Actinoplanes sp. LDG1-06]|uniref:Serine/threonine protein kinase n=1 Tax=Paractinoplanes ovalisporus TaxID=2810368 RepID=A0ABS2AM30_9ACTN|nr:serine/threonine-protein kinase [Actinoplanes ovalisporus]MBM2620889.1 serine/threonine protein kinase [Actinoplanes ovalisporus]